MISRRWRSPFGVLALAVALLPACSLQTATAPTGRLTLFATFDDAQDLTAGHNVQISNVVAGSVREVSLDGYRARVRLSIRDGHDIPVGTVAVVRRTSLLGEYFVDLVLPEDFDPDAGPFLRSDDEIERTETQPDLEQLAEQASIVVGAVTADDLAATVQAGAEGLAGRGPTLNQAVRDAAAVVSVLADQRADLGATVDGLARLGEVLAPAADRVGEVVEQLSSATEALAGSRARLVDAVESLVELATATNDVVLVPHTERLRVMLGQLEPLLGGLADCNDVLGQLIVDLMRFTEVFPSAVHKGTILLLAWMHIQIPGAGAIPDHEPACDTDRFGSVG